MQIKLLHTAIWAIMAVSIILVPVAAWFEWFRIGLWLTMLVLVECIVLLWNQGRCPLTDLAAPYTENRAANFDIYLPVWLARYNKRIFGFLFVVGEAVLLWRWIRRPLP